MEEINVQGFLDQQRRTEPQARPSSPDVVEQGSKEWYDARLGRFTGSEIHKLLSQPRAIKDREAGLFSAEGEKYIMDKVAEILTGVPPMFYESKEMKYGKDMEPFAANFFTLVSGWALKEVGFICDTNHPDHVGVSPDRLIHEDKGLEIKCPYTSRIHLDHLLLGTPKDLQDYNSDYYWQVLLCMAVTRRQYWYWISFDPRQIADIHKMALLKFDMADKAIQDDIKTMWAAVDRAITKKKSKLEIFSNL